LVWVARPWQPAAVQQPERTVWAAAEPWVSRRAATAWSSAEPPAGSSLAEPKGLGPASTGDESADPAGAAEAGQPTWAEPPVATVRLGLAVAVCPAGSVPVAALAAKRPVAVAPAPKVAAKAQRLAVESRRLAVESRRLVAGEIAPATVPGVRRPAVALPASWALGWTRAESAHRAELAHRAPAVVASAAKSSVAPAPFATVDPVLDPAGPARNPLESEGNPVVPAGSLVVPAGSLAASEGNPVVQSDNRFVQSGKPSVQAEHWAEDRTGRLGPADDPVARADNPAAPAGFRVERAERRVGRRGCRWELVERPVARAELRGEYRVSRCVPAARPVVQAECRVVLAECRVVLAECRVVPVERRAECRARRSEPGERSAVLLVCRRVARARRGRSETTRPPGARIEDSYTAAWVVGVVDRTGCTGRWAWWVDSYLTATLALV